MAIIQEGNDPNCKHEKTAPEKREAFGLVPVYTTNCLQCGEFMFRFPSEQEISKKDMQNAFEQTEKLLRGKPTD